MKIDWEKTEQPDIRWEYKDTIKRLGFWYGIKEYIGRIIIYWWNKMFYDFYEGHDGKFTYYQKSVKSMHNLFNLGKPRQNE